MNMSGLLRRALFFSARRFDATVRRFEDRQSQVAPQSDMEPALIRPGKAACRDMPRRRVPLTLPCLVARFTGNRIPLFLIAL